MNQRIANIALVVKDYDEAISFYLDKLNFQLVEDTQLSETKRWVVIAPSGDGECSLLLAKADSPQQEQVIGNQSGGRVFLFLFTDNLDRDYQLYKNKGVRFVRDIIVEPYGKVAVFQDLYGNQWDLIEASPKNKTYARIRQMRS